ncbi:hypothetical protein [Clostridium aminobutyricum]|uniref:Uncharacterized protein n=1 Tax=Clostridium aminobutyricum TaxID=33953 RepID=A0A939IHS9_CLOAM|nr:hypothetical protein [Clostridium aminobutyricum]MBN7774177.1 hypothetical protein [Clostridium aminobutyricum]
MELKNKNEAFEQSFSHIYATGVTTIITLEELLKAYTQKMCRDLEHCGVKASDEEIQSYLSNTYNSLKKLSQKYSYDVNYSF